MDNFIIVAIIIVIVGLASFYIIKSKKQGKKCIGCPNSACCNKNSNTCKSRTYTNEAQN